MMRRDEKEGRDEVKEKMGGSEQRVFLQTSVVLTLPLMIRSNS